MAVPVTTFNNIVAEVDTNVTLISAEEVAKGRYTHIYLLEQANNAALWSVDGGVVFSLIAGNGSLALDQLVITGAVVAKNRDAGQNFDLSGRIW